MTTGIRRWTALFAIIFVAALAMQAAAVAGQRYHDEVFSSVSVTSNIVYGQAPDEEGNPVTLMLDLHQPSGDMEPVRPAFVWIHGGGFTGGDKAGDLEATIGSRFAKRGYVVVSINYRLRPGHYFEQGDPELTYAVLDAQHDAQAAVRWLRANAATYRIDAGRIGVGGTSAGAITALMVAYNSGDPGDSGNPGYPSTVSAVVDVSGAMATGLIDAGEPPVLIVHGTVDERVAYDNALAIVARVEEVGVPYEFHPLEGIGHGVWQAGYTEPIIGWMSDFLYTYVAPAAAVGGIAEAPDESASAGDGPNVWLFVVVGAAAVALAAGVFFARRRSRGYSA